MCEDASVNLKGKGVTATRGEEALFVVVGLVENRRVTGSIGTGQLYDGWAGRVGVWAQRTAIRVRGDVSSCLRREGRVGATLWVGFKH